MSEHEFWNELGNLYFISGAYEPAIHAYARSIQLDRSFGRPYSNMALAFVHTGKYQDAIELYHRSIELLSDAKEKAVTWNRLGILYRQIKDYQAALVAYVRSLDYPANPYLKADGSPTDAAPAAAKRGYQIFTVKAGCKACHLPPVYDKKDLEDVESGGKFKVPSLRVVSRTAPYFHDGRFATLDEAVRFMWGYQQKAGTTEKLTDNDLRDLVEFLKIL